MFFQLAVDSRVNPVSAQRWYILTVDDFEVLKKRIIASRKSDPLL